VSSLSWDTKAAPVPLEEPSSTATRIAAFATGVLAKAMPNIESRKCMTTPSVDDEE
jgi:hypothetical protein